MLYKTREYAVTYTNLKIPAAFLEDFPMLQLIHVFALLNDSKNTALYRDKISMYGKHPKAGPDIQHFEDINKVKCNMLLTKNTYNTL